MNKSFNILYTVTQCYTLSVETLGTIYDVLTVDPLLLLFFKYL